MTLENVFRLFAVLCWSLQGSPVHAQSREGESFSSFLYSSSSPEAIEARCSITNNSKSLRCEFVYLTFREKSGDCNYSASTHNYEFSRSGNNTWVTATDSIFCKTTEMIRLIWSKEGDHDSVKCTIENIPKDNQVSKVYEDICSNADLKIKRTYTNRQPEKPFRISCKTLLPTVF